MTPTLVVVAALGLMVAVVAGCATSGVVASAPAPAATHAPTASPAASGPHKLTAGSLPAGEYTTMEFQPTLHFTLGEGWGNNFPDDSDEIALNRGIDTSLIAMTRVSKVVDPTTHKAVPAPDDMIGWLAAHPGFTWDGPKAPVEIAGLSGWTLQGKPKGETRDVDMFAYETGNMRAEPGNQLQFFVLPLDGPDLTIAVMAVDDQFDAVSDAVRTMLETLEIVTP
jgi:hypothetical protein